MSRPTEILIDLDALIHNCRLAKSLSGPGNIVAVVKADGYGHGAADIALKIEPEVSMFAVSCMEEAISLRKQGVSLPLLLLEGCFSLEEYNLAARQNIQLVIHNVDQANCLLEQTLDAQLKIWLKVDSGMHRLGVLPEDVNEVFGLLVASHNVSDVVLMTHLASADETSSDFTVKQLKRFAKVIDNLKVTHAKSFETSIANSAGLLAWEEALGDWNRPGIMLYGLTPLDVDTAHSAKLKPVMTFRSEVIALREIQAGESVGYGNTWTASRPTQIATLAVGYGDGYPRTAKTGTPVLINGQRCPLVGRVSMDMICVDVTHLGQVNIGDSAELWGKNLHANEVAACAGTIGYELVTRMPKRTKRKFIG